MKKSKFTVSQIIGYLRRMEQGEKTADLCMEAGVSQGTMCQWKSKYSGMEVSQLKKLKRVVTLQEDCGGADASEHGLKGVIEKKL